MLTLSDPRTRLLVTVSAVGASIMLAIATACDGASCARGRCGVRQGGKVLIDFGSKRSGLRAASAYAIAIQRDGKIVAAGSSGLTQTLGADTGEDMALARSNLDGSLDPSFGRGGEVLTNAGSESDFASAVVIQSDGKIIAAGGGGELHGGNYFELARYLPNGRRDESFGKRGTVTTWWEGEHPGNAVAIAVQRDGRMVAAGAGGSSTTSFALVRYTAIGKLDSSFGVNGRVRTFFSRRSAWAHAIAIQGDGRIVAVGSAGSRDFAVVRYLPDGRLDPDFGRSGRVLTHFGSKRFGASASAIAIQSDGKVVVAGSSGPAERRDFALARYLPDGRMDTSFGNGGKVVTDLDSKRDDAAYGVQIQTDGKIVLAGYGGGKAFGFGTHDFALVRYLPNGQLDRGFGKGGKVLTDFGRKRHDDDVAYGVAVQSDGRIVVAGSTEPPDEWGGPSRFALARYLPNGRLDPSFGH